jgi:hypothetical protein
MRWRDHVRRRLSDGDWLPLRELFDEIEHAIPLHHAYRRAHADGRPETSMFDARFRIFTLFLSKLDLQTDPPQRGKKRRYRYPETRIRLPRPSSVQVAADNRAFFARLRELSAGP